MGIRRKKRARCDRARALSGDVWKETGDRYRNFGPRRALEVEVEVEKERGRVMGFGGCILVV